MPLPAGAGWHADGTSQFSFGSAYFPRVDFLTHGREADVKVPWELSRLQWLVWLAEAAVGSDGERREEWIEHTWRLFAAWRHDNAVGYGPNWAIAMEVAIRALNLLIVSALLWPDLEPRRRADLIDALEEHRAYLRRFPELSDHVGNHYLVAVSVQALIEFVALDVEAHERIPSAVAIDSLCAQFAPDGLHVEHAPLYHRLCTEALLWGLAALAQGAVARTALPDLAALAGRACDALAQLQLSTDVGLPVLGDADSGQLYLEGEPTRRIAYLRGLLGADAAAPGYLVALAGSEVLLSARTALCSRPAARRQVGPHLVVRSARWVVVARAGGHGLHGRASHDHDDNGSPWIAHQGQDLVVDAGCFAYTRDAAERLHDLSSAAHNHVLAGGRERFRPRAGSMSPTAADAPVPLYTTLSDEGFAVSLGWTDPQAGAISHRRSVRLKSTGQLEVEDEVDLATSAPLELRWHLAPGWRAESIGDARLLLRAVVGTATVRLDLECAGAVLDAMRLSASRFSPRYGARERLTTVATGTTASTRVRMISRFTPMTAQP